KIFFENTLQPILHVLVFIVGVVLNVWGLKSLLHDWKKVRTINILVLNLGLADMLYLLTLPFLIVYYLKGAKWTFGEAFCKVTRFCFNLNLYCSIGFLTCISVYRYLAIVYPIRALGKLTITHTVVISAMVWILVSAQSLPDMTFPKSSVNKTEECFETTDWEHAAGYLNYSLGWTFTGFCIPFIIILGCYMHVTVVICRSHMMKKNKKRQVLKLLVFLILLFSLCFAPYHVLKNLNLYSRVLKNLNICSKWDSTIFVAHQASRGLVSLNSALNPLVYLHVNKDMGFQFRQLLQGCQQKISCLLSNSRSVPASQTEQEIDSPSMTADVF
ncbi:hypothetical protein XENOCAPTIV_019429, partial [Xenoophorus captivus]